jgi:hypothetical protein
MSNFERGTHKSQGIIKSLVETQMMLAEEAAGKKHDEAMRARTKKARKEFKNLFCVKYHQAKSEKLNTVSAATPEVERYFDLLKRRANVTPGESLHFYTDRNGYNVHPGVTPIRFGKHRQRNPAVSADNQYHGGQFHNGEW